MRIGILTLNLHNNYGGNLQAYALMSYLKGLGHDVVLLNRTQIKQVNITDRLKIILKKIIGRYVSPKQISVHSEYFKGKYISPITNQLIYPCDYAKLESYNFEAIIVGSDQVWRADYIRDGFIDISFLDFIKKPIKKISYAASLGFDSWDYSNAETRIITDLIKDFDLVTVREDSAVRLLKENTYTEAFHVIDPTMLINREEYLRLIRDENAQDPNGDCMVYILDREPAKQVLIDKITSDLSLSPFVVNQKNEKWSASLEDKTFPPVTDWLNGFAKAKFVITDSFHGTVFSILFNKPFLVIGNTGRGLARFESLGRMFDISNRIILDIDNFDYSIINQKIDWEKINLKLENERIKSYELISSILK